MNHNKTQKLKDDYNDIIPGTPDPIEPLSKEIKLFYDICYMINAGEPTIKITDFIFKKSWKTIILMDIMVKGDEGVQELASFLYEPSTFIEYKSLLKQVIRTYKLYELLDKKNKI